MARKSLRSLHQRLSWNTKIYVLLVSCMAIFAQVTGAFATDFSSAILLTLLVVLLVESVVLISGRHPMVWQYIKWVLLFLLLMLILIGSG